ncbi:hypothetical protein [Salinibius halmophilus]|uniref:hypothetical protein n=1 Tax=Salinibius halmophilus TaxID=1853216 RepID=UPI000E66D3FB|nr:hypothetical protein [Salinibius halmophilus]
MKPLLAAVALIASPLMAKPIAWEVGLGSQVSQPQFNDQQTEQLQLGGYLIEPAIWLTYHFDHGYLGTMGSKIWLTHGAIKPIIVGGFDHLGIGVETEFGPLLATAASRYYWFDELVGHKVDATLASIEVKHNLEFALAQVDASVLLPAFQNASLQVALVGEASWQSQQRLVQEYPDQGPHDSSGNTYRYGAKGQWQWSDHFGMVSQVMVEQYDADLVRALDLADNLGGRYMLAFTARF